MPTAMISVYLNDEDYSKYVKNKEELNSKAREVIKNELGLNNADE